MLNRISKTILILTICLGISIPTNAAVSVSDGSAFVTKAEFAADLNNLSNRMAQLENSLDAKIDSLVSSYLTRNGIWNGASQIIVNSHSGKMGLHQENSTKITVRAQGYTGASVATDNKYQVFTYDATNSLLVIQGISKSGLMVLELDINNTIDGVPSGRPGFDILDSETSPYPIYHYTILSLDVLFYTLENSIKKYVYTWNYTKSYNDSQTFVKEANSKIFSYFFVSKGDNLYLDNSTSLSASGGKLASWNCSGAKWYWVCDIASAYVY